MTSVELIRALVGAHRRIPKDSWRALARRLSALEKMVDIESVHHLTADIANRDAAWIIEEAICKHPARGQEIAAAMAALDEVAGYALPSTEIIWTGPANNRFPVRRVEQVLYDLIAQARKEILLVTFAAHRIPRLCAHLGQAIARGVELKLIVESEGESEGQLTKDAIAAFQDIPLNRTRIYYWPVAHRDRNAQGRPGKLHVKCAVIDDVALIGSANLTDDAFNRNMELGVLIRERSTVVAIQEHFQELIESRVLVQVA